ncbi:hypothetical protein HU200_012655 [Digitaria exilis]|uniref:Uncharacterized protein n=1 Tax=Digitaria exilis TaxID=1010633 RepID=A0A835FEI4_9POAL|nr:hypothetical protein HU200_012655 [Digitaria exilis]
MPASSSSGGSACASSPPPPPPRAMKRELAFALRSLSQISASPGRTRSGRPISSLPDPSASMSLKRRKRSDPPAAAATDLVSPPTPPVDAEPPTQPLRDIIEPVDGSIPPPPQITNPIPMLPKSVDNSNSNGGNLQPQAWDNALAPDALLVEDTATPVATAELKPTRRFTRSLLKNKPGIEESADGESQATPDGSEDAPFDLALLLEKPHRSASDSPPSVKKMEMKMSKKVACLTKHPVNIRELLNTGLLEGMPVMYIIPHSKKDVLKGVITGCNILCFCPSCNGSKVVRLITLSNMPEAQKNTLLTSFT